MTVTRRLAASLLILIASTAFAATPTKGASKTPQKSAKKPPSSLIERIGDTGIIEVEAESFKSLTPREQEVVWWLTQASIAIDPIIYDQLSRFGLREKSILELIAAHPTGIDPTVHKKIDDYTKLFWVNHGNHNDVTAQKFVPAFTAAELEKAALIALRHTKGASLTEAQLQKELAELQPAIFDPDFEPALTAKSPRGGLDIIQASANNFYGRDVTMADLKDFKEEHPTNSRVIKSPDGKLVEEVYRAGTPDGSVPPGLYAQYLGRANEYLTKAKAVAEPGQAEVIDALIRFYQTGDLRDWIRFGILWVANNPRVDFANGFIEVYRDARGAKGTSQSFVSVTDEKLNQLMLKIAGNAKYFEQHAPWLDQYKKLDVKPPLAKAIETVVESGDFPVTIVGDNLPNEDEVREKYGTKSFLFTGSTRALNHARGAGSIDEFAYDDEEKRIVRAYGDEADDLLTALHEIIGHGSGKSNPKLTADPLSYLKEYGSTLEEGRADLMALWNITDPKLRKLGLVSSPEVAKAMYYRSMRAPLTQLQSIPKGDTIEEDHQRDRALIVNYIMDKVPGSVEMVTKPNGNHYMHILDFDKVHTGVGLLLAELMRIKAEGDYEAIKTLIDKYGVHFDPKLRDEIVARYKKLNLPNYWAGVSAELHRSGSKVTMVYPHSLTKERLGWAAMYAPEVASGAGPR